MKHIRIFLLVMVLASSLTACKDDSSAITAQSQTNLLVANKWLLTRVATTSDQTISQSQLNLATLLLYELNMEFKANNTVRAINTKTQQIVNGGTWTLAPDNRSMDVVVTGFTGNFPIIELSRTKLTLRQRAPIGGKDTDINLEFVPSF